MPRFPVIERQQSIGAGATASYASAGAFTAPANALADAGGAMADIGAALETRQRQIQNSQEDTWFSKARADTALEMQTLDQQERQAATNGAEGYTQKLTGQYQTVRERMLASAPSDRAKQMYDEWSYTYGGTVASSAATFQAESTLAKRNTDFASAMLSHSQVVLADPSQYDAVHQRAMDDLEGAKQWMTPEQELGARDTVEKELQLARAKAEIQRDPQAFLRDIGVGEMPVGDARSGAAALLREFEGFRETPYWDVNANRVGYGTDTITRADGSVKRVEKGDRVSRDDAERDLKRRLVEFENGAIKAVGADAWSSIPAAARAALLSVAYNYGSLPNNVVSAVRGGNVQQIAAAVDSLSSHNGGVNASRRRKEAAVIRGQSGISGGANPDVSGDPRYSHLGVNELLGLQQQAESTLSQMETQRKSAQTSELAQIKGAFQLGIATGDTGVTQQSILSSPLADDDKAQLITSLNSKNADARLTADAISRIDMGSAFDAYNDKDKKGVSLAYDAATGGAGLFADDSNAQAVLGYMYGRSGIVPKTAANEIRAGLVSSDPMRVAAAASVAAQLDNINRGGLDAAEGGSALQKAAATYNHMHDTLGLTNEEIGERMVDMNDPEKQRQRAALLETKKVKDRIKKINAAEVRDVFDPGFFGFDPALGDTPLAEAAMVGDYRAMFEESLVDAAGDEDLAKTLAAQRFSKFYGVSDLTVSGSGTITRLPPDITYPPAPDGTHDYVSRQAIASLAEEGVETDEVFLQYYEGTESDYKAGKPPRYQLYYMKDGSMEMFHLPFYADHNLAVRDYDAEQARNADESRREMEKNREEELRRFPEGRSGPERYSNDDLYYGVARESSAMGRAIRNRREAKAQQEKRLSPLRERDQRERQDFDALDPSRQRERNLDDFLNGPAVPRER